MTSQEIMAFQGHEFTYCYSDGDTMPAYIKKIDLDKNLITCWSFSLVTDQGYKFKPLNDEEEAEAACCVAYENSLDGIISLINQIKTTGKFRPELKGKLRFFFGCPF